MKNCIFIFTFSLFFSVVHSQDYTKYEFLLNNEDTISTGLQMKELSIIHPTYWISFGGRPPYWPPEVGSAYISLNGVLQETLIAQVYYFGYCKDCGGFIEQEYSVEGVGVLIGKRVQWTDSMIAIIGGVGPINGTIRGEESGSGGGWFGGSYEEENFKTIGYFGNIQLFLKPNWERLVLRNLGFGLDGLICYNSEKPIYSMSGVIQF